MHSSNWDNLRFVLAVADHGSVSAAARMLGVNHATVLRRVAAFETRQGGPVFERTATGYRVLPDRTQIIDAAREVDNAVLTVDRLMHGTSTSLRGVVRVSSTDTLCQCVLPPLVARLHSESSELQIDLLSTNTHLDFARMQADIAVRPGEKLPEDMTGEIASTMAFQAYCTPDSEKPWLGLTGPLARSAPGMWMSANVGAADTTMGADSFMVLREMALLGMGVAILPVFLGATTRGLVHQPDLMPMLTVPIWVASHMDLRDVPRIRIVRDRIGAYLSGRASAMDGTETG